MPSSRNLYDILNVAPDAEPVVVEAAYRALMKKYHPDQASGETAAAGGPTAAEINEAFAVLRDADRRADYDRREWTRQQNVQLARYQPPAPPKASRVFGWGGWIVAAVMAGLVAVLANQASELAEKKAQAARAEVESGEPDLSSQPRMPKDPVLTPAAAAEIRADAFIDAAPVPAPAPVRTRVAPARSPDRAAAPPRRPRAATAPQPPRSRRADRPSRSAQEKDFLERQGYIY